MTETATGVFAVSGMHCASCGMLIDDVVEDLDGVRRSQTKLRPGRKQSGQTTVVYDPARCSTDDILAAIIEAGYQGAATSAPG